MTPARPQTRAAAALAAIFFAMEQLPDASTRPDYAPDAETMGAGFGLPAMR